MASTNDISGGWSTAAAPKRSKGRAASTKPSGGGFRGGSDHRGARREGGGSRSDDRRDRGDGGGGGRGGSPHSGSSKPAPPSVPVPTAPIGGFIFFCNNETIDENLERGIFGLVARWTDVVREIKPGLPLFLYNYSNKEMHGGFVAASQGAFNIDPEAWLSASFGNKPKQRRGKKHRTSPFPAQVRFDRAHDYAPLPFSRIPAAALTISGKGGGARSGMKNPHFEHILQAAQCEKLLAAFKAQPRRVAASPSSSTSPRASPTAAAAASRGASPQPATQQPGAASTEGNMWTRGPPRAAAEAARKRAAAPPASAAPAAKAAATRRSKPASKPAAKAAPKRAATAAAAPASTAPAKSAASSSKSAASAAGASAATAEEEPKPTSGAFSWADRLKASNIAAQAKQGAPKAAPKAGAATAATAPAAPAASKAPRTIAARTAPSQAPAPQASKTPTQASKTPTQAPKAPTQQQQQQQQRSTGKGKGKKQSAKAQPSSTLNQFVKMWETMQSAGGQPGLGNGYTKQDALAAVARIKATVTTLLSEATVIPQGSFAVDLWLPGTSNVDLVVELPASASLGNTSAAVAQVAAGAMNPGSAPFSPGAPGSPDYQRLYSSLENLRVQLHADTQTPWASQIIGGHPSPTLIMRLQPGIAPGRPTQPGPIPIGITVRVPGHTGVEVVELSNGLLAQIPLLRPLLYVLKQLIRVGVQGGLHEAFRGGLNAYSLMLMTAFYLMKREEERERAHAEGGKGGALAKDDVGDALMGFLACFMDPSTTGVPTTSSLVTIDLVHSGLRLVRNTSTGVFSAENFDLKEPKRSDAPLFVEDPLQKGRNAANRAHNWWRVQYIFAQALASLDTFPQAERGHCLMWLLQGGLCTVAVPAAPMAAQRPMMQGDMMMMQGQMHPQGRRGGPMQQQQQQMGMMQQRMPMQQQWQGGYQGMQRQPMAGGMSMGGGQMGGGYHQQQRGGRVQRDGRSAGRGRGGKGRGRGGSGNGRSAKNRGGRQNSSRQNGNRGERERQRPNQHRRRGDEDEDDGDDGQHGRRHGRRSGGHGGGRNRQPRDSRIPRSSHASAAAPAATPTPATGAGAPAQ